MGMTIRKIRPKKRTLNECIEAEAEAGNRKACNVQGHRCPIMAGVLAESSQRRTRGGISNEMMFNFAKGESRFVVVYQTPRGDYTPLTVCPWCGGKLHKAKRKGAAQ